MDIDKFSHDENTQRNQETKQYCNGDTQPLLHEPNQETKQHFDGDTQTLLGGTEQETSYGSLLRNDGEHSLRNISFHLTTDTETKRWKSIHVMYFTIFIEAVTFSVILPSLWSYIQDIDSDASATLLGWANSVQGLFALVSAFTCGWTAGQCSLRVPLITTLVMGIISNVIYMCVYIPEYHQNVYLLVARALAGVYAGCNTVTRIYIGEGTTMIERTQVSSRLVASQLSGYVVGPLLQMMYIQIGEEGWTVGEFRINMYTFPAITNTLLIVINLALILFVFREIRVPDEMGTTKPSENVPTENIVKPPVSFTWSDMDLPVVMYLNSVFCAAIFSFGFNATLVSPYGMHLFGWSREDAAEKSGIIALSLAVLAIVVIAVMVHLLKRIQDRVFLVAGIVMLLTCTLLQMPMGPGYPPRPDINGTEGEGGCPWTYDWCDTTPTISLIQYSFSLAIFGVGYPMLQGIAYIIYSKAIGPSNQGLFMGIFSSMGNFGKVIAPILGTFIYTVYGVQWAIGSLFIILIIVTSGIWPLYRRIVPYTEYLKYKQLASRRK